ncbi:hypothetical protein CLOSTMETH_02679 [[Clostridium] methylpentosum DSM 5476]|uniref:Uncharacterized protein n=1 Tax=[Clostridium] methylpentosum DSM 5476 TaxID=537013 RepID=C0EFN7_9FIRM|nr:hypothetical protein CLOSTMETH_02679 [[Clostridium] methylpentosum DSM 5476]
MLRAEEALGKLLLSFQHDLAIVRIQFTRMTEDRPPRRLPL